jgi:hypothetical protein
VLQSCRFDPMELNGQYHSRIAGPAIINSKNLCHNNLEIIGLNS